MSQKWIRSKRWDDQHLTGVLTPVKWVLRALSSIPLAVVLLVLVSIYGVLASVPIGLLAVLPTKLFYWTTVAITIGLVAVVPVYVAVRMMKARGVARPARFAVASVGLVGLSVAAVALWNAAVWPHLRFDPIDKTGVRFFADFVDRYESTALRRLPGLEMSELEFYDWWPLRVVLILFVINMVVATVRRIEFNFLNIGVLTVHTGIVTIALGSIYYNGHKQEGDMALLAGSVDAETGRPGLGRAETGFYDNTDTALWVSVDPTRGWEQRRLRGLPRYNDYNLDALNTGNTQPVKGLRDFGPIDVRVPGGDPSAPAERRAVDPSVSFRIVGYSPYAELEERWITGGPGEGLPMRTVEAYLLGDEAKKLGADADRPQSTWRLIPEVPAQRSATLELLAVEYTRGMPAERWAAITAPTPAGARHALVVEHPASGFRSVYAASKGATIVVGETGYTLEVKDLAAQPPFPIITRGYENASSSLAIVGVTPPADADGTPAVAYERYVYHRFPEISQDMLAELNDRGMPKRRDAEPSLKIWYVDASLLQVYLDEDPTTGLVRASVRLPGGQAVVTPNLSVGGRVQVAPSLVFQLGERQESARRVELPRVVPESDRDRQRVGNHENAVVAVEVMAPTRDSEGKVGTWTQTVWVPFTKYIGVGEDTRRNVRLPDGSTLAVAFGRVRHEFWPPMAIRLVDFEMTPYPHSDTPRDYRSDLLVLKRWERGDRMVGPGGDERGAGSVLEAHTSLNDPLLVRTPFVARADAPGFVNFLGWVVSLVAPNQYKFAQAGWDQSGWRETSAAAVRGELPKPYARFTILGVGNNPGIYVIAAGAVMMSVGIPWAFYVKPALIRRRKKKIQSQLAAGTYQKPARPGATDADAGRVGEEVTTP